MRAFGFATRTEGSFKCLLKGADESDESFNRLGTYTCRVRVESGVDGSFEDVLSAWARRRESQSCH